MNTQSTAAASAMEMGWDGLFSVGRFDTIQNFRHTNAPSTSERAMEAIP